MHPWYPKTLLLLRLALGWIFIYSSVSKIMAGDWSAAGYLQHSQTFPQVFAWFANPQNLGWVNFLNVYGQLLIGISLVSGVFIKLTTPFAILLMILYYLPSLHFPYAGTGTTSFLVDQHVIFTLVFLLLSFADAGKYYSFRKTILPLLPKSLKPLA